MADLTLTGKNPTQLSADALVVGTCSTSDGVAVVADQLPASVVERIETLAPRLGVTGALQEVRTVPAGDGVAADVLVLAGLGERQEDGTFDREALRAAAGSAVRSLAGSASAVVALPAIDESELGAVVEGALLGAYSYTAYRDAKAAAKQTPVGTLQVATSFARTARAKAAVARAEVLAAAVHGARDLVNTPPNVLYPASFADAARTAVKELGAKGVKVTVLDDKQLAAGGYGGLTGVGQGSARGPRLVKLTYSPAKATGKVALVGKGITFDTGGISIKPAAGMDSMKSDMAGAAAVLHTVVAAARLGLPVAVTGYLCLAENMPGGNAQRPADVVTIRGGKTVEVLNTDAEGRLVMADGLVSAVEDGHDVVLDIATLTGAQMVALGRRVSAVMGTEDVRDEVKVAADTVGEQFWPMPLPDELAEGLRSKVADIANVGERWGGMLAAGLFLRSFIEGTPWAHLDIAGPAYNEKGAFGYTPAGGTGVGVRTMLGFLESRAGVES
ncbi:leucyl aminopeptidase [Isoptericola jiangsuensis]|uniref:leucyl aminopeptidase n=1 Tax=Isoptericola jiangsuensis TaxID=548579 RepID=UPI003AAE12D6